MRRKRIIEAIKYWSQVFLLPIYWLSFLIPRNRKIWVFGSTFGKRFADNPKYFYLYLCQRNEIKAVWISKDKELVKMLKENKKVAFYLYSLKGVWYSLRAKVYLFDNYSKDISFFLSGGAIKVNMWHGIPLKKINMDNKFDLVRHPISKFAKLKWVLRRMSDEKPSHYILTTSKFMIPIFSSAFKTNNVLVCGYPRTDIFKFNNYNNLSLKEETLIYKEIVKYQLKKVLYMPTFRKSESEIFNLINFDELQNFLNKENIIFCVKLHPKSIVENKWKKIANTYKNIILIDSSFDPYPFLNITDILITDYSSVYFDYLVKNKPIIFFNYDYQEYINNSRELYFDYNEYTPGIKVQTMDELLKALIEEDIYDNQRKKIEQLVFEDINNASERLYFTIQKILNIENKCGENDVV